MVMPLNAPREIRIAAAGDGRPVSVQADSCPGPVRAAGRPASVRAGVCSASIRAGGRLRRVARIGNEWRIDDEWWRQEVSRHYFDLELADGRVVTVFHDLISGKWYQQRY